MAVRTIVGTGSAGVEGRAFGPTLDTDSGPWRVGGAAVAIGPSCARKPEPGWAARATAGRGSSAT